MTRRRIITGLVALSAVVGVLLIPARSEAARRARLPLASLTQVAPVAPTDPAPTPLAAAAPVTLGSLIADLIALLTGGIVAPPTPPPPTPPPGGPFGGFLQSFLTFLGQVFPGLCQFVGCSSF